MRLYWTEERVEELRSLAAQGLTAAEIAERMGKNPPGIRNRAAYEKIPMNYVRGKWSEEEKETLWRMVKEGKRLSEVATVLNRSDFTVRMRAQRYGMINGIESRKKRDLKPRTKTNRKKRKCLGGCGEMFDSEWEGNRICPSCAVSQERRVAMI